MIDRTYLSAKNRWKGLKDKEGPYSTIDKIMETMAYAMQKAVKMLNDLEKKAGLIKRKLQGLGN